MNTTIMLLLTPFDCKITDFFKIEQNIENTPFCLENGQNDDFMEHMIL